MRKPNIQMLNILKNFFLALVVSLGGYASENHHYDRFNFSLNPGIDVYASPRLMRFLEGNLDSLFDRYGYSPSSYYIHEIDKRTGVKPLEEIVTNQSILSSVKSLRYQFRKFFRGISIRNTHDLELKTKGIDITANWSKFGMRVVGHQDDPNKLTAIFVLRANRIGLDISSLRVKDHRHEFIGEIGGDKFYIKLDENNSEPLEIIIPIMVSKNEFSDRIRWEVRGIESNVSSLNLLAGWNAPLKLPTIKIRVNNRTSYMKARVVERTLKDEIPNLLIGIQENVEEYLLNEAPELVENLLENNLGKAFKDYVNIPILFNPDSMDEVLDSAVSTNPYPDTAIIGMKLNKIGIRENHLRLQMNSFLEDGKKEGNSFLPPRMRAKNAVSRKFLHGYGYDLLASVDIGLINQYIRISCNRGYLRNLELGDEVIQISGCPYLKAAESANELRMVVHVTDDADYSWYQISGYAVNNPLVVRFELALRLFVSPNGKVGLKFHRIIPSTAFVAEQYINFASDSVHEAARERLVEINREHAGKILEEEIPLPVEVNGVSLKYIESKIDKNGNILFYIKTIM